MNTHPANGYILQNSQFVEYLKVEDYAKALEFAERYRFGESRLNMLFKQYPKANRETFNQLRSIKQL